jgi:hypothetical protein
MQNLQSNPLAGLMKFGAGAGIFFLWTLLEKQIIEPFGIYRYMPFYRVEGVCAWDVLVAILIVVAFVRLGKRSATGIR